MGFADLLTDAGAASKTIRGDETSRPSHCRKLLNVSQCWTAGWPLDLISPGEYIVGWVCASSPMTAFPTF